MVRLFGMMLRSALLVFIVNVIPDDFPPNLSDALIIAKYDIVRIELHHLLEAYYHKINVLPRKAQQFLKIFVLQKSRVNHVTVPRNNVQSMFLMCAILQLLVFQYLVCDIILEILHV